MSSPAYVRGVVRIDVSDPTGFWRDLGMVKSTTIEVPIFAGVEGGIPQFSDLSKNFTKVKVEKDDDGNIIPVTALHVTR